jgi:hypothetical protein
MKGESMLQLPIALDEFNDSILCPALKMLPAKMDTAAARILLAATCLQESSLAHRWQVVDPKRPEVKGPARGLAQFEQGGGVRGVMTHAASKDLARKVCEIRDVAFAEKVVYENLDDDDVLALALARLLYWTDARAMPALDDTEGMWQLYLRTWRPGAYARDPINLRNKWTRNHAKALAELRNVVT